MQLVETITVGAGGAASIEFTSIPQDADDLLLVWATRLSDASAFRSAYAQFNGVTTTVYSWRYLLGTGSSASSGSSSASSIILTGNDQGSSTTANTFNNNAMYVSNYAGATFKSVSIDHVAEDNSSAGRQELIAASFNSTDAITSIKLFPSNASNFVQYSTASLYKITKA